MLIFHYGEIRVSSLKFISILSLLHLVEWNQMWCSTTPAHYILMYIETDSAVHCFCCAGTCLQNYYTHDKQLLLRDCWASWQSNFWNGVFSSEPSQWSKGKNCFEMSYIGGLQKRAPKVRRKTSNFTKCRVANETKLFRLSLVLDQFFDIVAGLRSNFFLIHKIRLNVSHHFKIYANSL